MKLYDLRTEYRVNPIGIDRRHPRFSWKMESEQADTVQKSYRILVRTGEKTVWEHRKEGDTSVLIPYAGTGNNISCDWECWNSILPDGSFDVSGMNSLNHYAYGSIGDWMYRKVAGVSQLKPGYKKFRVQPMFVKGIE